MGVVDGPLVCQTELACTESGAGRLQTNASTSFDPCCRCQRVRLRTKSKSERLDCVSPRSQLGSIARSSSLRAGTRAHWLCSFALRQWAFRPDITRQRQSVLLRSQGTAQYSRVLRFGMSSAFPLRNLTPHLHFHSRSNTSHRRSAEFVTRPHPSNRIRILVTQKVKGCWRFPVVNRATLSFQVHLRGQNSGSVTEGSLRVGTLARQSCPRGHAILPQATSAAPNTSSCMPFTSI